MRNKKNAWNAENISKTSHSGLTPVFNTVSHKDGI